MCEIAAIYKLAYSGNTKRKRGTDDIFWQYS